MIIKVADIRIDGDTQVRMEINQGTVDDYAELIQAGTNFPPLTVFHDGKSYWLADGFHRYHAARKAGTAAVQCDVSKGTVAEARWAAVGANVTHGLRRTNADKRRAVEMALELRPELSDESIAEHAGVSRDFVFRSRKQVVIGLPPDHRVGKDGKTYPMPPMQRRANDFGPPPMVPRSKLPPEPVGPVDKRGVPIPPEVMELWNRRQEVQDFLTSISRIRSAIEHAHDNEDPLWSGKNIGKTPVNFSSTKAHLDQAYQDIKAALPEYVCPYCHGITGCRACSGIGLISSYRWDTQIPREMKGEG